MMGNLRKSLFVVFVIAYFSIESSFIKEAVFAGRFVKLQDCNLSDSSIVIPAGIQRELIGTVNYLE